MNSPVVIYDFEDSFTYNIANCLFDMGIKKIKVLPASCLLDEKNKYNQVAILGPGPGHPLEYEKYFPKILSLINDPTILTIGICLGHQLIWKALGGKIVRSFKAIHGSAVDVKIPAWNKYFFKSDWGKILPVQRYNSLAVKIDQINLTESTSLVLDENDELLMSNFSNTITYQFHPESVGTSCPEVFFAPVYKYLYNIKDGPSTKNRGSLQLRDN